MKKYLILMRCIICVFLCSTISHAAKLTFNNLAPDDDIGAYMTGIYGSEFVVKGATTSQPGNPGDGIYLTNLGENPDYNYMSFEFNKAAITSLSFDIQIVAKLLCDVVGAWWGAFDAEGEIIGGTWVHGEAYKEGLIFDFSAPVSKLVFISSNNAHVDIDNPSLVTPEPATMFLLGFGLVGITTYSRRKLKNRCRPSQKLLNLGYIRAELS